MDNAAGVEWRVEKDPEWVGLDLPEPLRLFWYCGLTEPVTSLLWGQFSDLENELDQRISEVSFTSEDLGFCK